MSCWSWLIGHTSSLPENLMGDVIASMLSENPMEKKHNQIK